MSLTIQRIQDLQKKWSWAPKYLFKCQVCTFKSLHLQSMVLYVHVHTQPVHQKDARTRTLTVLSPHGNGSCLVTKPNEWFLLVIYNFLKF